MATQPDPEFAHLPPPPPARQDRVRTDRRNRQIAIWACIAAVPLSALNMALSGDRVFAGLSWCGCS